VWVKKVGNRDNNTSTLTGGKRKLDDRAKKVRGRHTKRGERQKFMGSTVREGCCNFMR